MPLTTPDKLKKVYAETFVDEVCKKIEEKFDKLPKESIKYLNSNGTLELIIEGEYDNATRNSVATRYKNVGWRDVRHRTSSENGERGGLTIFTLFK